MMPPPFSLLAFGAGAFRANATYARRDTILVETRCTTTQQEADPRAGRLKWNELESGLLRGGPRGSQLKGDGDFIRDNGSATIQ